MQQKNIYKIQRFSIHDGPGIRTTLFFQGCPLSCTWCHNPESQVPLKEQDGIDTHGVIKALMTEIEKDVVFFEESHGGVTFSGGEPMMQHKLLFDLAQRCRDTGIHTALDTSGYASSQIMKSAATRFDLILYDIKLFNDADHLRFTGMPLGPVLKNLKVLSDMGSPVRLRFPTIPDVTAKDENVDSMIEFLMDQTLFRDIHILPLHKTAAGKYKKLNREDKSQNYRVPTQGEIEALKRKFEKYGFHVTIGG